MDSLQAFGESTAFVGIDDLIMQTSNIEIVINQAADEDGVVVDFATEALEVVTGPGQAMTFDMDGSRGELIQAAATIEINLFNFFSISGDFAFVKSIENVTLSNGEEIEVDYMSIGATNVTSFVGLNGGSDEALGLNLSEVTFGLALMTDRADSSRKFTSLQANAGGASFTGIDGLVIEADT